MSADSTLTRERPTPGDPAEFRIDPSVAGDSFSIDGSNLIRNTVALWRWPTPGTWTAWTSPPSREPKLMVGNTSVSFWVRSSAGAGLQAVVSAVDAEGDEVFIQSGWMRLDRDHIGSADPDGWSPVTIELGPAGHLLARGSSLRLQIGTPGDGQAQWTFYPPPSGAAEVAIAQSSDRFGEFSVTLIEPPAGLEISAACGDLRAQPCRKALVTRGTPP